LLGEKKQMKGMFKIALYSAPVLGLVLVLVLGQLEKHDAQMEAEKAQFDQQFAHDNDQFDKSFQAAQERIRHTGKSAQQKAETSKSEDKDTFWTDQRKEAEQRLDEAKKRVAAARGKVDAASKAADQALEEIEKDDPQSTKQNQKNK
jgi:septal ring factor EnvC (AmiA/AmiB activator)